MKLDRAASLLVIDVQQGFLDPHWGERNNPAAERHIARLLQAWRQREMPVIHVQHDSRSPHGSFFPGKAGNAVKPEAEPWAGESIHRKSVNSAFIGTGLETELRERGIGTLMIVGLTTNHCVSTTARMAGNMDYDTYVVADATATFARPTVDGRVRSAQDVHDAALSDLNGEFATIVDTESVLAALATSK